MGESLLTAEVAHERAAVEDILILLRAPETRPSGVHAAVSVSVLAYFYKNTQNSVTRCINCFADVKEVLPPHLSPRYPS